MAVLPGVVAVAAAATTTNICWLKRVVPTVLKITRVFVGTSELSNFFGVLNACRNWGPRLPMDSRVEQCLAHVREAEEHANQAADAYVRESWLGIANSYRQLAQVRLSLVPEPASELG